MRQRQKISKDFHRDIAKDLGTKFYTSECSKDNIRALLIEKKQKIIGMLEDGLGGKIMTEVVRLSGKFYAYKGQTKSWKISAVKAQKRFRC